MEYAGPELADFSNVRALNREYLLLLTRRPPASSGAPLPAELATCLHTLRPAQCERLAATPFLLFSFRERDDDYWSGLLDADGQPDLFAAARDGDDAFMRLIAAGLGFLWQLARRNPYAARVICGASIHWCERLAERTLLDVVAVAAASSDVLVVREADNEALWRKLLDGGTSSQRDVRRATHISALQSILTSSGRRNRCRPAIAARRAHASSLKVADETVR